MKKTLFLPSIFLLFSLLVACGGNNATPEVINDESKLATIVASTLSAVPSSTPIPSPTTTIVPTPTNTAQPFYTYQNSEFGFECLYPLDITSREGEASGDFLLFSVSFVGINRVSDEHKNDPQKPAVSIVVFENPDRLSLKQWLAIHTGPSGGESTSFIYQETNVPIELSIDGHPAIIFEAHVDMAGTNPILLIENDQQVVQISEYSWEAVSMRDVFLVAASSFKFSLSKDTLTINNEIKETLESALNSLSQ